MLAKKAIVLRNLLIVNHHHWPPWHLIKTNHLSHFFINNDDYYSIEDNHTTTLNMARCGILSLACVGLLVVAAKTGLALDNGLALTPPMGWLAWERFVCETDCSQHPGQCINEQLFLDMAERLVEDGFRDLGYQYVNIDDCWSQKWRQNDTGQLRADPSRFKSGSVRHLADQVHSMGLKLGIYGDCGTKTCQAFPGQLKYDTNMSGNYFDLDAKTFATDWQVDSFKFDGCNLDVDKAAQMCPQMERHLNATGRPVLFSCSWPAYENDAKLDTNWTLAVEKCNLWRAFGDIEDSWKSVVDTIDWFVLKQDTIAKYHGPGHWFDADQLVIGNFGLSHDQELAHMAIWCIWASPLYMSNDLRSISGQSSAILRNQWAIGVNQDPLGVFGMMVLEANGIQVFVKPVEPQLRGCPSYAVAYLNRRTLGNSVQVSISLAKILAKLEAKFAKLSLWPKWNGCATRQGNVFYAAYDLMNNNTMLPNVMQLDKDYLSLLVNPSSARLVKLVEPNGDENSLATRV